MSLFTAKLASLFVDIVVNSRRANTVLYQFNNNVRKSGQQVNAFRGQLLALGLASSAILLVMKASNLLKQAFDAILETSVRLEKSFLEIQKNVQLSADGFASLQQETLDFATTVTGINIDRFQEILIASSRMGIEGKDNIMNFSKAVALIARVSEGVSENGLAEFMYRLTATFNRNADEAIYLGNTLIGLSNAFAVNEQKIIETTDKLMGSAEVLGLTAEETLALAAATRTFISTTERASSGLTGIFRTLASDPLGTARTLFGNSEEEAIAFARTIETDPYKALIILLQKLKEVSESGQDLNAVLTELNLEDKRVAETTKILMNNINELEKAYAKQAETQGNVLDLEKKSAVVAGSLSNRIERLSNAWTELKNTLGDNELFVVLIEELRGVLEIINFISAAVENSPMRRITSIWTNPSRIWGEIAKLSHKVFPVDTGVGAVADAANKAGPSNQNPRKTRERDIVQREDEANKIAAEQMAAFADIEKEYVRRHAELIENEYLRERKLEELNFQEKISVLQKLHNEEKINHADYANALNEEAALHKEIIRQLEKRHQLQQEEERLRKFEEFKRMIDEIIALEKEWMQIREDQNIAGTEDTILQGLLEIEAAYRRNIERIKELEAERAKAEDREINKKAIDDAIKDEDEIRKKRSKKLVEDAEKDFRKGIGQFALTDAEQQREAIKERFDELKKQAAELGRADLFPALNKQMQIELGQIGKPEARFSGLQDVWKNAQLEFLKTPKEEVAILKDIAKGQDRIVDAVNNQKPVAAVGP